MIYLIWFASFCSEHPFLAWCSMWLMLALIAYSGGAIEMALVQTVALVNRFIRLVNIAIRGWPPAHCDADGDPVPSSTATDGDLSLTQRGDGFAKAGERPAP